MNEAKQERQKPSVYVQNVEQNVKEQFPSNFNHIYESFLNEEQKTRMKCNLQVGKSRFKKKQCEEIWKTMELYNPRAQLTVSIFA